MLWAECLSIVDAVIVSSNRRLSQWRTSGGTVAWKKDGSPVTTVDRLIEEDLFTFISSKYPGDTIVGEETGSTEGVDPSGPRATWFIDPVDGTVQLIHGQPFWSVLIGRMVDGQPEMGIVHFPDLGITYASPDGRIAMVRSKQATWESLTSVPHCSLENAYVLHNGIKMAKQAGLLDELINISDAASVERGYSDAFGHMEVIAGRSHLMVDFLAEPHDVVALAPIADAVGALQKGIDWTNPKACGVFVTANPGLTEEVPVRRLLSRGCEK